MSIFSNKNLKEKKIVDYRKIALLCSAFLGVVFFVCFYIFLLGWFKKYERLGANLIMLILGLPTFFLLWFFRTHDTRENINSNAFFNALSLFSSEETKRFGVVQLMYLQNKVKVFKDQIDLIFQGINLNKVDLREVDLQGAKLQGANLQGANLENAELQGANLQTANLSGANLQNANLSGANLSGANLSGANLLRAKLQDANLQGANLEDANLSGANLRGANLLGANLSGANLRGANLRWVIINRKAEEEKHTIFHKASYDEHTELPDNFKPEDHIMFLKK